MTFKVIFKAVSSEEMQGLSLGGLLDFLPPPCGESQGAFAGLTGA